MNDVQYLLLATLAIDLGIASVVFVTNPKRVVNQCYVELAALVALWQISCLGIVGAQTPETGMWYIRMAYLFTAFIPTACQTLRISIIHPDISFFSILGKSRQFILTSAMIGALCFTDTFLKSVRMPIPGLQGHELIEPDHGPLLAVYTVYLILAAITIIVQLKHDIKMVNGVQREELCFFVIGASFALLTGASLSLGIPYLIGTFRFMPFSNALSIIILTSVIAYGIATRKILGTATILRKITAYALMGAYLVAIYLASWKILSIALPLVGVNLTVISHLIPALVVAFTMAPMNGRMQRVANKLITAKVMDIPETMKKASEIFQSVTTVSALLNQYTDLLKSALDAETVAIIAGSNSETVFHTTAADSRPALQSRLESALGKYLQKTQMPACLDELNRQRPTDEIAEIISELGRQNMKIGIGTFSKSKLIGIVMLGERSSGHIYDKNEKEALQILCNQFSIALQNAQLYTEMQDSKIRNEIMLEQLVNGVILADMQQKITLINHEAQRITGMNATDASGQGIGILPSPLASIMNETLDQKTGQRHVEARLFDEDDDKKSLSIRMSTTFLVGHDQQPMGALLVFTDMTEVKSLEAQVRRSDQLSSLGTLAAGMAHEIKNPLVTIKTFTQLLPDRYDDDDFRKDFSSLVAHEVMRIDSIVNQLLGFSKPTRPNLVPMHLHGTIEQALKLTQEQMAQNEITHKQKLSATDDRILGDTKLLSQTIINLTLNAIEAIGNKGSIVIETSNCNYRFAKGNDQRDAIAKHAICMQISDTGHGIPEANLQEIFNPFFTSKSEGTGMGLSVALGIVVEHHGAIEVKSQPGKGTTFYLYIPLLREENA